MGSTGQKKVVLITGCASGIGRSLALGYHARGQTVIATDRDDHGLKDLAAAGMQTFALDVNDSDAINQVFKAVDEEHGGVDVLINNAGYGVMGPTLEVERDRLRHQFETNVFAPLELIQRAARTMIPRRTGIIVNVGSVSGILTTPFAGPYCASKSALHSLSDALRMELAPFNIRVITFQPGGVRTRFGDTAGDTVQLQKGSRYAGIRQYIMARTSISQERTISAEKTAAILMKKIERTRPPRIIRAGPKSIMLPSLRAFTFVWMRDLILSRKFGLHHLKGMADKGKEGAPATGSSSLLTAGQ